MNHQAHKEHQGVDPRIDAVARQAVDAGLKVHKVLGPGLLESAYEHQAQVLTYLKLAKHRLGLLMNFNVPLFTHGVKRLVL